MTLTLITNRSDHLTSMFGSHVPSQEVSSTSSLVLKGEMQIRPDSAPRGEENSWYDDALSGVFPDLPT